MLYRALATAALSVLLTGCGMQQVQQSVDDAQAAVSVFHSDLDSENFDSIRSDASDEFRKAASKEDFTKLFAAIHRKLGKSGESKQVGWRANTTTSGTFISLRMETEFERGRGTEDFVFVKKGDDLQLLSYNVTSPALIIN